MYFNTNICHYNLLRDVLGVSKIQRRRLDTGKRARRAVLLYFNKCQGDASFRLSGQVITHGRGSALPVE